MADIYLVEHRNRPDERNTPLAPSKTYIIKDGKCYKAVDDLLEFCTEYIDNDCLPEVK